MENTHDALDEPHPRRLFPTKASASDLSPTLSLASRNIIWKKLYSDPVSGLRTMLIMFTEEQ